MSIIIIAFPAAPKIDQEAKRKDQELDRLLKQKVEGKSDSPFAFYNTTRGGVFPDSGN